MKNVVLVDGGAARVRRFREAVALYRETVLPLQARTQEAQRKSRNLLERARRESRALRLSVEAHRQRRAQEAADVRLHVFPTAAEAWKFLRREDPYRWAPQPSVVFTDLYLGDSGGAAFVERLRAEPGLQGIPTVVLCSGAAVSDVRAAWEAGSNAVVDLPWDGKDGLARVADVLHFWLSEAATPP